MTPMPPPTARELTPRAVSFLATLERRPSIPTERVEALIVAGGYPCFAPWLAFHERYAGYLEVFGQDWAIWGLIHENPVWLLPNKPDIDRESEDTWYARCADAHPTYQYQLDQTGELIGMPAESFDVNVERLALGWEFHRRGKFRIVPDQELRGAAFREVFEREIKGHLVSEASDHFSRQYMSERYLVVEDAGRGILRRARELM